MNSPPTRNDCKNSSSSFSVSELESGVVAGGRSCTDTLYTRFASNPDIRRDKRKEFGETRDATHVCAIGAE